MLLLGLSASAVVWTVWQLRNDAIRAAIAESGNIATLLANQLSRSLQAIDSTLLEIKRSAEDQDIDSPSSIKATFGTHEFQETLTKYLARVPQVFNIAVADKDGRIVVTTAGWPAPFPDVSGRDYFLAARDRQDGQ